MLATLRNPLMPPALKAQLRAHVKMTNHNLLQMQMLAAQGMLAGMAGMGGAMGGMGGMGGMNGMGMGGMNGMNPMAMNGMNGMNGMGNNMNMNTNMGGMNAGNMNMNMNANAGGMGMQQQQAGRGGRGGFRGGFRGRGGFARGGTPTGPGRTASGKRPADEAAGGMEKMQRVA